MHSGKFSGLSQGKSLLPWVIREATRPSLILAYFIISGINSFNLSGLRINTRYLPSKTFTPRMTSIDGNIQYVDKCHATIFGVEVPVCITIENSFETNIDFSFHGMPYHFRITQWARRGQRKFLELFHAVAGRDINSFGVMVENPDGSNIFMDSLENVVINADGTWRTDSPVRVMTHAQKINAVIRASKDILICLNLIGQTHGRAILDYCVWYREHTPGAGDYSEMITKLTCHSIVHADFLAPDIWWQIVEFPRAQV